MIPTQGTEHEELRALADMLRELRVEAAILEACIRREELRPATLSQHRLRPALIEGDRLPSEFELRYLLSLPAIEDARHATGRNGSGLGQRLRPYRLYRSRRWHHGAREVGNSGKDAP